MLNVADDVRAIRQQGETGTRTNTSDLNLRFVDAITSVETCASMPNYQGAFWFNYIKRNIDHNLAVPGGSNLTTRFVEVQLESARLAVSSQHSASLTHSLVCCLYSSCRRTEKLRTTATHEDGRGSPLVVRIDFSCYPHFSCYPLNAGSAIVTRGATGQAPQSAP